MSFAPLYWPILLFSQCLKISQKKSHFQSKQSNPHVAIQNKQIIHRNSLRSQKMRLFLLIFKHRDVRSNAFTTSSSKQRKTFQVMAFFAMYPPADTLTVHYLHFPAGKTDSLLKVYCFFVFLGLSC